MFFPVRHLSSNSLVTLHVDNLHHLATNPTGSFVCQFFVVTEKRFIIILLIILVSDCVQTFKDHSTWPQEGQEHRRDSLTRTLTFLLPAMYPYMSRFVATVPSCVAFSDSTWLHLNLTLQKTLVIALTLILRVWKMCIVRQGSLLLATPSSVRDDFEVNCCHLY